MVSPVVAASGSVSVCLCVGHAGNVSVDATDIALTPGGEDLSTVVGRVEAEELLSRPTPGSFLVEVNDSFWSHTSLGRRHHRRCLVLA